MMELGDRYTSDTDCASPPDFKKGYPMPEGWQWACYDDGTGCLEAPDGYCYLDYMDLPKGGLRLPNGHYLDEPRADEIARLLECDIIPQHNARVALASEHPDWWCAFNPHTFYYHDAPTSAVRVAISPEKSMDAAEFRSLLEELRQADAWLTTFHLAEMLSRSPTVPHKGVTVEAKSIEPIVFACTATLADAPMASKSPDGEREAVLRERTQVVSGGHIVSSSIRETPVTLKRESMSAREASTALLRESEEMEDERKEELHRRR